MIGQLFTAAILNRCVRPSSVPPAPHGLADSLRHHAASRPQGVHVRRLVVGHGKGGRTGQFDHAQRHRARHQPGPDRERRRRVAGRRDHLRRGEQQATFASRRPLAPGTGRCTPTFTGILNDKLHGFYRSTYTDADGDEQVIATTQFEATDARRAFPCWDEPDFKAVFAVTLDRGRRPDGGLATAAWSPTIRSATASGGSRFADTMKMSTYLVAFVVGPARAHRAGRRRRRAAARRLRARARATSATSRSRSARTRSTSSPTTSASRIPATSST